MKTGAKGHAGDQPHVRVGVHLDRPTGWTPPDRSRRRWGVGSSRGRGQGRVGATEVGVAEAGVAVIRAPVTATTLGGAGRMKLTHRKPNKTLVAAQHVPGVNATHPSPNRLVNGGTINPVKTIARLPPEGRNAPPPSPGR